MPEALTNPDDENVRLLREIYAGPLSPDTIEHIRHTFVLSSMHYAEDVGPRLLGKLCDMADAHRRSLSSSKAEGMLEAARICETVEPAKGEFGYYKRWKYTTACECAHAIRQAAQDAVASPDAGWVMVPQAAIDWLMGLGEDFEPPNNENLPRSQGGAGRYWWRSEFRKRAGIAAPRTDAPT